MSYRSAEKCLHLEIVKLIQDYVDGELIYIPRKESARRKWGEATNIRRELYERNHRIYADYRKGMKMAHLAMKYYLSEKSIQRIIRQMKTTESNKPAAE